MATAPKYTKAQRIAMQRKAGRYVAAAEKASPVGKKAAKFAADKLVTESMRMVKVKKPVAGGGNVSSRLKTRRAATQKLLNSK